MNTTRLNPMAALSRIGKRLKKDASGVGLEMRSFTAVPDIEDEEGIHRAQAMFTLNENFTPVPPKDDEWEQFAIAQAENDAKAREEQAKEGLGGLLKELGDNLDNPSGGIL